MHAEGHPSGMTWMPERAAGRGRRAKHGDPVTVTAQGGDSVTVTAQGGDRGIPLAWPDQPRDRTTAPHPLGIPRILGRRARWVGARLRRET
jgi:hypothetical protein